MEKKKCLEDFQDFVNIVGTCRQSLVTIFEIPGGVSQAKYSASKPKLEDIQSINFDKGHERMFWKTSHTEEEFYSGILQWKSIFFKEISIKILEMIFSELKCFEV